MVNCFSAILAGPLKAATLASIASGPTIDILPPAPNTCPRTNKELGAPSHSPPNYRLSHADLPFDSPPATIKRFGKLFATYIQIEIF